jgi:hypothetical protein
MSLRIPTEACSTKRFWYSQRYKPIDAANQSSIDGKRAVGGMGCDVGQTSSTGQSASHLKALSASGQSMNLRKRGRPGALRSSLASAGLRQRNLGLHEVVKVSGTAAGRSLKLHQPG